MKKYIVVYVYNIMRQAICTDNKPNWYGTPKIFKTKKAAEKWIEEHTYGGMSHHYEIEEEE